MEFRYKKNSIGFTLLEMLLVLAIVSSILVMVSTYFSVKTDEAKRDSTVMRYEQVLNAALAYYINYSKWPTSISELVTNKYLPKRNSSSPNYGILNAWGQGFTFYSSATTGTFSICSLVNGTKASADSSVIAGRLPMAYVGGGSCASPASTSDAPDAASCSAAPCAVVSTVNIPGQNLNNARSVNFAGVYHNGACVPAPTCPTSMTPTIVVAPISVSGTYDGTTDVYPLSSFTAYAKGKGGTGTDSGDPVAANPLQCTSDTLTSPCTVSGTASASGKYWRVCLDVVTEKGRITGSNWKSDSGAIMAITRCVPTNEPQGSDFTVFQSF